MRIDLHTHSNVSDGTDTPAGLMASAVVAGLDVIALTDHDTTAGWAEAIDALPPGLTLVPGAELSCVSVDSGGRHVSVHLLAYLFDPAAPALVDEQRRLRAERRARLWRMAEKMAADGLPIDPDAVLGGLAEDAPAGRPHLARALIDAGKVSTVDEAFRKYLGNGCGYYLPRHDTPVQRAVRMIADAGGVTVFAHAFAHDRGPTVTPEVIVELAGAGLTGLEVDHPNHDAKARAELRGLATELGLLTTGSSDYHGGNKTIRLGQETTDPDMYAALAERATGTAVVAGGTAG